MERDEKIPDELLKTIAALIALHSMVTVIGPSDESKVKQAFRYGELFIAESKKKNHY